MKTKVQQLRDQLAVAKREHLRALSPASSEAQLRRRVTQLRNMLRQAEAQEAKEKADGGV